MASTSSRRGASQRPQERHSTRSDDPWCLVCGVNLALDGRTFTIVSQHHSGELCDVFLRVLGMKFTEEHASVNVCNRCERQLKRLARTTSIAIARHEGRKFRDQMEKNIAKHGQLGVELGDFRDFNSSKPASGATKNVRDDSATSAGALNRSKSFDRNTAKEHYSRSNSFVRFEDDREAERKGAGIRDRSAPERTAQKRDLTSSFSEADRNKDVRRGYQASAYSTSAERMTSLRTRSTDRKMPLESKMQTSVSHETKSSLNRPIQKKNALTLQKASGKISNDNSGMDKSQKQGMKMVHDTESQRDDFEDMQRNDKNRVSRAISPRNRNPFTADEQRPASVNPDLDTSGNFHDDDTVEYREDLEQAREQKEYLRRKGNLQDPGERFIKPDKIRDRESTGSSESSSEDDSIQESYRANIEGKKDNTERVEQLQGLATDEDRDRVKKFKVTFSERDVNDDAVHEPQTTMSSTLPRPTGTSSSASTQNNKGKLFKYESLDLEIEKNNPFFDDVYGEYKRRVTIKSYVRNDGQSQGNERGSQKPESIPETEAAEVNVKSITELESKHESETVSSSRVFDTSSHTQNETVTTVGDSDVDESPTLLNNEALKKAQTGREVSETTLTGENQQDNAPLIEDTEDNVEDRHYNKDIQDATKQPDESEDDVQGTADGTDESLKETAGGQDEKYPETQTAITETQKPEGEEEIMKSEVIKVNQERPPVNFDDEERGQGDAVDEIDSQIALQPLNAGEASKTKTEASPLIDKDAEDPGKQPKKGKDSKFKDQQPGFACCTVL